MIWYVWAVDSNNAIEELYQCHDYASVLEARGRERAEGQRLFKVEVTEQ